MLEMLMVANSAFAVIKKTIENGQDIASAGSAISKKRNSIWTAFLGKTDNDLEEFMALEQIKQKQDKLREYMQLYGRPGLWSDYQQYCADARKARREAAIKAKKRREYIKELTLKIILGILITAMLAGVVTVLVIIAKKRGII